MGLEMSRQAPHLESLAGKADNSQKEITVMTKGAKKYFRV